MALKGVTQREQGLLEAAGLWERFVVFRKRVIANGRAPNAASVEALVRFMSPDGKPRDPGVDLPEVKLASPAKKENDYADLAFAPDALAGKSAMEPEVARWVARNIDNPDTDPADCPDPFAWTLLRMCRQDPGVLAMFIKDIWTKLLVSQAKLGDDKTDDKMDGTPTVELITRIRLLRDKSNSGVEQWAARQAHNLEVEGSSPSPASSFEKFKVEA